MSNVFQQKPTPNKFMKLACIKGINKNKDWTIIFEFYIQKGSPYYQDCGQSKFRLS